MRIIKKANGDRYLTLKKSEWQKIGKQQNWIKVALPVHRPSPEAQSQMEEDGIRLLHDINRLLPNTKIRELKQLLSGLGGIEGISLPKVFYPEDKNVVTYKGKEYYYLHHEKSKAKSNPGKLWLLDLDTGEPLELPYEGTVDELNLTDSARREEVRSGANKAINEWNAKIDKLDGDVGLITIPLRVQRTAKLIDERLIELNGQVQAIESQAGYGTQGSEQWQNESLEALRSGTLNDQDAVDTALFWYQERPEDLLNDLSTFNVSDQVKQTLTNIANAEIANKSKKNEQKQQTWEDRQTRMDEELPEIREPIIQPVPEFEGGTLPGGSVQKPDAYRSFQSRQSQKQQKLKEIGFQIQALEGVQGSLQGVNAQIAGMEKGQFTNQYLQSPEGRGILQGMRGLLDSAYGFIKKYTESLFTQEGQVNPKLFGSTGSMGNVRLAVELNRLYNAIRKASTNIATAPMDETVNVEQVPSPPITGYSILGLMKKANENY